MPEGFGDDSDGNEEIELELTGIPQIHQVIKALNDVIGISDKIAYADCCHVWRPA